MFALLLWVVSALAAVDVNTADASALESLPGIGPSKAEAILAYRTAHGPFKSIADLDAVDGIGPSTLANIKDLVSFGAAAPASPATVATASEPPTAAEGTRSKSAAKAEDAEKPSAAPAASASAGATPAASSSGGCPVNINTAGESDLGNLPGIGPSKAAAILKYRTDHGNFASCEGLDDVSGIGPATLAGLTSCCVVK